MPDIILGATNAVINKTNKMVPWNLRILQGYIGMKYVITIRCNKHNDDSTQQRKPMYQEGKGQQWPPWEGVFKLSSTV